MWEIPKFTLSFFKKRDKSLSLSVFLFQFTGLQAVLPPAVHLLTLAQWDTDLVLLRLEHQFQAEEGQMNTQPETVNLQVWSASATDALTSLCFHTVCFIDFIIFLDKTKISFPIPNGFGLLSALLRSCFPLWKLWDFLNWTCRPISGKMRWNVSIGHCRKVNCFSIIFLPFLEFPFEKLTEYNSNNFVHFSNNINQQVFLFFFERTTSTWSSFISNCWLLTLISLVWLLKLYSNYVALAEAWPGCIHRNWEQKEVVCTLARHMTYGPRTLLGGNR